MVFPYENHEVMQNISHTINFVNTSKPLAEHELLGGTIHELLTLRAQKIENSPGILSGHGTVTIHRTVIDGGELAIRNHPLHHRRPGVEGKPGGIKY